MSRRPANDILETAGAFGRLGMSTCMMASPLNLPTAFRQRTSSGRWYPAADGRGLLRAGGCRPCCGCPREGLLQNGWYDQRSTRRVGPSAAIEGSPAIWRSPFAGCTHPFCSGPAASGVRKPSLVRTGSQWRSRQVASASNMDLYAIEVLRKPPRRRAPGLGIHPRSTLWAASSPLSRRPAEGPRWKDWRNSTAV